MTHRDKGNFSAKHPPGKTARPRIADAVGRQAEEGKISCLKAVRIALDEKAPLLEVGLAIDLLEISISECQLGLFGFGKEKRIIKPLSRLPEKLEARLAGKREISCTDIWALADELDLSRFEAACACETLKIKIRPCQLGAF